MTSHSSGRKAKATAASKQAPSSVRHFVRLARTEGAEGSHPSTMAVARRPQPSESGRRVAEYARIARGHLA